MSLTTDPEDTLERLRHVRVVAVDSSSLIYARKSGLLGTLIDNVKAHTVPGVVREIGFPIPGVRLEPERASLAVDDQVLAVARDKNCALLAEDRKLLEKAEADGVDYYNMLVMLELFLLRGTIDLVEWDRSRKKLLAAAHYSPRVVHAGNELHWAVRKEIG